MSRWPFICGLVEVSLSSVSEFQTRRHAALSPNRPSRRWRTTHTPRSGLAVNLGDVPGFGHRRDLRKFAIQEPLDGESPVKRDRHDVAPGTSGAQ